MCAGEISTFENEIDCYGIHLRELTVLSSWRDHDHRFRFYATIGGFSSKENCVSAAVNHRYHIWKCTDEAS